MNLSSLSLRISLFSYSLPGYCTSVLSQRAAFTHIKELLIAMYCNLSTRLPANLLIPQREGILLLLASVIWSLGLCLAQSKCLVSSNKLVLEDGGGGGGVTPEPQGRGI